MQSTGVLTVKQKNKAADIAQIVSGVNNVVDNLQIQSR